MVQATLESTMQRQRLEYAVFEDDEVEQPDCGRGTGHVFTEGIEGSMDVRGIVYV